jgi:hypothetical protein
MKRIGRSFCLISTGLALACSAHMDAKFHGSQADTSGASTGLCGLSVPVDPFRSIEIVHPNVVNDQRSSNAGGGAWSFAHLLTNMAPSANQSDIDAFLRGIFETFGVDQQINGVTVPARTPQGSSPWLDQVLFKIGSTATTNPTTATDFVVPGTGPGTSAPRSFDLANAPFKLIAIAMRLDLAGGPNFTQIPNAGEGRFVFGLAAGSADSGTPKTGMTAMTLIMEYKLPLIAGNSSFDTPLHWTETLHQLDSLDPAANPSGFNAALETITDVFTARGAAAAFGTPNGSAIATIRTNDIALTLNFGGPWQLREFNMNSAGLMVPATTKNMPLQSLDNSQALATFINANADALTGPNFLDFDMQAAGISIGGSADESEQMGGDLFTPPSTQAGLGPFTWAAPGVTNAQALRNFSLLTCNGCHQENKDLGFAGIADQAFLQISPIAPPGPDGTGRLSQFLLTGTGENGGVGELERRANLITGTLCAAGDDVAGPQAPPYAFDENPAASPACVSLNGGDPFEGIDAFTGDGSGIAVNYDAFGSGVLGSGQAPAGATVNFQVWALPVMSQVSIQYAVNGDFGNIQTMPLTFKFQNSQALVWGGSLPPQASGSTVTWWVEGTDVCHSSADYFSNNGGNFSYVTN